MMTTLRFEDRRALAQALLLPAYICDWESQGCEEGEIGFGPAAPLCLDVVMRVPPTCCTAHSRVYVTSESPFTF